MMQGSRIKQLVRIHDGTQRKPDRQEETKPRARGQSKTAGTQNTYHWCLDVPHMVTMFGSLGVHVPRAVPAPIQDRVNRGLNKHRIGLDHVRAIADNVRLCACPGDEDLHRVIGRHSTGWYLPSAMPRRYPVALSTSSAGRIRVSALVPPRTRRGAKAIRFLGASPTSDEDAEEEEDQHSQQDAEQLQRAPTRPREWS